MADHDPQPSNPWEWSEERWRGIVGRARGGRSLAPRSWPDGAGCCVALSFDADHETIPLRNSDESPMRITRSVWRAPGRAAHPSPAGEAWHSRHFLLSRRFSPAASEGGARFGG